MVDSENIDTEFSEEETIDEKIEEEKEAPAPAWAPLCWLLSQTASSLGPHLRPLVCVGQEPWGRCRDSPSSSCSRSRRSPLPHGAQVSTASPRPPWAGARHGLSAVSPCLVHRQLEPHASRTPAL